ncbi:MAG: hypothetical protein RB296_08610 [Acidobacteriota bacterium]|jgi:hypothetical protein|nr:hypothetical protein [Acidobacteriota bacterium]
MEYEITLKIDGKDIALNPFVRRIFSGVFAGLIDSLDRLPEDRERIEVILNPKSPQKQ